MEKQYWSFSVEVYENGNPIDKVTGHNVVAESPSEAEQKAYEYGQDHYPSSRYKLKNAQVERMQK